MQNSDVYILAIESSCDDTAAAVLKNNVVLSNVVANQLIHNHYGGVVPELASRAHQQNIVPVVLAALQQAGIVKQQLSAIAFTQGPGLMGSLLVGSSFAKSMALALSIPLIAVNHMHAHIFAHFIDEIGYKKPAFPFLALTISGGHTQIVLCESPTQMKILQLLVKQPTMQLARHLTNRPKYWVCRTQAVRLLINMLDWAIR